MVEIVGVHEYMESGRGFYLIHYLGLAVEIFLEIKRKRCSKQNLATFRGLVN
jgi:hypothetical protein